MKRRTHTPGRLRKSARSESDTQLIILSAASQRGGVELPANVKGEAAGKVVDKLIRDGLLEEELGGM